LPGCQVTAEKHATMMQGEALILMELWWWKWMKNHAGIIKVSISHFPIVNYSDVFKHQS